MNYFGTSKIVSRRMKENLFLKVCFVGWFQKLVQVSGNNKCGVFLYTAEVLEQY